MYVVTYKTDRNNISSEVFEDLEKALLEYYTRKDELLDDVKIYKLVEQDININLTDA